jgi:hypothetical protein
MVVPLAEPLWLKQSIDEIDCDADADDGGKRKFESHRGLLRIERTTRASPRASKTMSSMEECSV